MARVAGVMLALAACGNGSSTVQPVIDSGTAADSGTIADAAPSVIIPDAYYVDSPAQFVSVGQTEDVVADGTRVYYNDLATGSIWSLPRTGGDAHELASGEASPLRLALDDTYVYWLALQAVRRAPKDGSDAARIVAAANGNYTPYGVAV